MSTPNFETQDDYPLMIIDETDYWHIPVCPECNSMLFWNGVSEWECDCCGYHTEDDSDLETTFDDLGYQYEVERVYKKLEDFNKELTFSKVTLKDGYYSSVQTYVESNNPHYMENYETRYEWDLCRSQAIRKYDSETRKVNKYLHGLKDQGLKELSLVGVFSNGEAVYHYV